MSFVLSTELLQILLTVSSSNISGLGTI